MIFMRTNAYLHDHLLQVQKKSNRVPLAFKSVKTKSGPTTPLSRVSVADGAEGESYFDAL
jgi:hypothetical protein